MSKRSTDSLVVYTDYSGKSDQISYYAVRKSNGQEYIHDYGFSSVPSYLTTTEGEMAAARSAMSLFPGAKVLTDSMHVVGKLGRLGNVDVAHVKAHCGNVGNEHADQLARNSQLHPKYKNYHSNYYSYP